MPLRFSTLAALGVGIAAILVAPQKASAQASGTWTNPSPVSPTDAWSNTANWAGGIVATGANNTANFNTLDIADQTATTTFPAVRVDVDAPRTIGHLVFGDTNIATPGVWEITSLLDPVTNLLTLADATKPSITVNQLGVLEPNGPGIPPAIDDVIIRATLSGSNGFTKLGSGILTLGGVGIDHDMDEPLVVPPAVATPRQIPLRGVIDVNAGTLRILAGTPLDFVNDATSPAVLSFNLATGATLAPSAGVRNITMATGSVINATANVAYITASGATTINTTGGGVGFAGTAAADAASGVTITGAGTATVNWNLTGTASLAGISGTGGVAIVNIGGAGLVRLDRNWAQSGALASVTFNGTRTDTLQSTIELRNNGGGFGGFQNEAVILNNVVVQNNQNTGGNDNTFGSLAGDANAVIQGGTNGAGSSQYFIGGLNTNTTFAGTFRPNAAGDRSLTIVKQGTGTLTLSGTINNVPSLNQATIERRGGVFRIMAGTLKLTNTAMMPAGLVDATFGDLLYTVDVRAGATMDVSGTSTVYQSAALQQLIGAGTIVGTYNHSSGIMAPGNISVMVGVRTTANTTPVAGTLNFTNTLEFAGSGQINFDISPSLVSGNDLIQVGGANVNGTPVVKVGFLGGASNGAYTLLNSNTPLVGTTSGWTVLWEGRGAAPTITQTATQVKVNVSAGAAGNLNWRGTTDGAWNAGLAGTSNWQNTGTNAGDKFFQLDNVAFRDTYDGVNPVANTTITLNTTVSPSSVVVNNSAVNYTVSGTGRITGGGSFTKQGSGTYTITTANDYSGTTTIQGGTLALGTTGSIGAGPLVMTGGSLVKGGGVITNATTLSGTTRIAHSSPGTLSLNGSLSGTGTLTLGNANTTTVGAILGTDFVGSNSGFSGTIIIGEFDSVAMVNAPIAGRLLNSAAGNANVAWQIADGSNLSSKVDNVPTTHQLGSLSGGTAATLSGHGSSAGGADVTWQIGALNTSTTFAGIITDGNQTSNPGNKTSILKVGTGTLTLTNPFNAADDPGTAPGPVYTGFTKIKGGTLSTDAAYLADTSDVYIDTGAVFNLNTGLGTIDVIDSLFLNNVPQPIGTYGAPGSGATFTSAFFTGTGQLSVTTLGVAPIPGDFDGNGSVNAADLTVWRGAYGNSAGGDADGDNDSDGNDFAIWQRNLGLGTPTVAAAGAVPEPAAWLLAAIVLPVVASGARRRRA